MKRRCDLEHPGDVLLMPGEAEAVKELSSKYATGTTTLSQLAFWLNDAGFRRRTRRNCPSYGKKATSQERRKLLLIMLDGVYIDAKDEKRVVAIKAKPAFRPVFQVAATKAGSDVVLIHEEAPINRTSLCLVGMRLTAFRVPCGDGEG